MLEKLSYPLNKNIYPAHGGNGHTLVEGFGVPGDPVIDFSASVNSLGPSPNMRRALSGMEGLLAEYPDSDSRLFSKKVSEYLNISPEWILVTNGSTELIHLLPQLLECGKEALILNPCFSEYERAFRLNKTHVHSLEFDAESQFLMSSDDVVGCIQNQKEIGLLVLGHPNNPTGHLWDTKSLKALVDYCESQKVVLAVDETFIDFSGEQNSALQWMQGNRCLVVVRSMTKFFGLAGVRLGYGVMHPDLKDKLKEYQVPWSVNAIAQKMGIVALEDDKYSTLIRKTVDEQRLRLFSGLNALSGIRVFPSQSNFFLFQLSDPCFEKAHQLYINLMKGGVLIRNCGNFSGLDNSYFRVAVRTERENQILITRLKAHLDKER